MNKIIQNDIKEIINNPYINWENFRNKTILITGATGLIGSMLVYVLKAQQKDLNLKLIAQVRDIKKALNLFGNNNDIIYLTGDIIEPVEYDGAVDYIIHCACNTSSQSFVDFPVETILNIVTGTKNILELAKLKKSEMIFLSSLEVYGQINSQEKITEKDYGYININDTRSSYIEGKRAAETLCCAYSKEFNIPVKIARPVQILGSNASVNDKRVVNYFAKCIAQNSDIILHTKGETKCCFCYITDVISALIIILLKGESAVSYNIADEESFISIKNLAEELCEKYKQSSLIYEIDGKNRGYKSVTKLNISTQRLKNLGWNCMVNLEEGFSRLISSFKAEI